MENKLTNREKQAIETKRKLIHAAEHVFLENGFEKTTISQIIKQAGVGYGTAYVYFKNKDEMLVTIMEEVMDKFFKVAQQHFQPGCREEAIQQIKEQVSKYMSLAIEEREILKIVKEAIGLSKIIEARWEQIQIKFIEGIISDITYSQTKHLVSPAFEPAITARSWYYMNEMFLWQFVESSDLELKPIVDQLSLFYTSALYGVKK